MIHMDNNSNTIKPRTFSLRLSDADIRSLYEKAFGNGITPEELIEGYIGDLIFGSHTHGSDERMYAEKHFDRCNYNMLSDNTFLKWAIKSFVIDEITDLIDSIDDGKEDLLYYTNHPEDPDNVYVPEIEFLISQDEKELKAYYRDYLECDWRSFYELCNYSPSSQSYEDSIDSIRKYNKALNGMLNSCWVENEDRLQEAADFIGTDADTLYGWITSDDQVALFRKKHQIDATSSEHSQIGLSEK